MPLHIEYRPKILDDFVGNDDMIEKLGTVLGKPLEKIPHAYLFTGPIGCGKTTLARIVAQEFGCDLERDFVELDSAVFRSIDDVREVRKNANMKALGGKNVRCWLFDEVHMLGQGGASAKNQAQSALLKLLEEPPDHTYFFLCTSEPQGLLEGIRSRCSVFEVELLDDMDMLRLLKGICRAEGKAINREVLDAVIHLAEGHPRNALVALDQVIDLPKDKQLDAVKCVQIIETTVIDLCRSMLQKFAWPQVRKILLNLKDEDPEKVRRAVLGYCNKVLLQEDDARAFIIMDAFRTPFYDTGAPGLTMACYDALASVEAPETDDVPF